MKKLGILSISALLMCACSSSEINELDPSNQETALLSISTSVLTQDTKAGVTRTVGGVDAAGNGPVMGAALAEGSKIGVCVYKKPVDEDEAFVDYPVVTGNSNLNLKWTATTEVETTKQTWTPEKTFYLQEQNADVYAYFPYNEQASSMTAIPVTPCYTDYL